MGVRSSIVMAMKSKLSIEDSVRSRILTESLKKAMTGQHNVNVMVLEYS